MHRFAPLFKDIENEIHSEGALGIDSYGTSMPTLEEVFLRLGDEETEEEGGAPKVIQQVDFCVRFFHYMTFDMQLFFLQEDERRNGQEEMVGYEFEPVSTQKSTWQAYKALLKVN